MEALKVYESQLEIPQTKPVQQFMVCPVGLLNSGKSTVVGKLAKDLGLLRISADEIRQILLDLRGDIQGAEEIAKTLHLKYLQSGFSIAIDADCASPTAQEFISYCASISKVKIVWIHINPPVVVIRERLKDFKKWRYATYEEALKNLNERQILHQNLPMKFVYTFDTSRADVPKQITDAEEKIKEFLSKEA